MVFENLVGRRIQDYFPDYFMERLSPTEVLQGHCLACRVPLTHEEMNPPGRMPRYMCDYCYQQIALNGLKFRCLTCAAPLPRQKVQSQASAPRELKHALHDGPCSEYHWLLAGIVLGVARHSRAVAALPPATQRHTLGDLLQARLLEPVQVPVPRITAPREVKFLRFPE
jgi:hypothetical protein